MLDLSGLDLGDLVPKTVQRLGWMRDKPVYRVEDQSGQQFVVKVFGPPERLSLRARAAFAKELVSYQTLPATIGERVRIPKLISFGPGHLVLEYLAPAARAYQAVREQGASAFAEAVAAFHWDTPDAPLPARMDWLHRVTHSPESDALLSAVRVVPGQLGFANARRCLAVINRCRRQQSPLPRRFNAHNDLWASNVLPSADGRFQLIDFACRTTERRWVLDDVIRFGFLTRDMDLTRELIDAYMQNLEVRKIPGVAVRSQIRFSLLRLGMGMLSWNSQFQSIARSFIVETLLDNTTFEDWVGSWRSPFPPTDRREGAGGEPPPASSGGPGR
jgi:hypothetical protein